ncbi:MAG: molybdopterin molybdotransferase MoeA [Phycisphaeraceae bacterium]
MQQFVKLPTYDESLALVLRHVPPLGVERVALALALGRVLREDVRADRDQPPFDRSAMDGFAVRSSEVKEREWFPVKGTIPAGASPSLFQNEMPAGAVMRIATGAPLPRGADAMVPIEQAVVEGEGESGGDGERVSFVMPSVRPWQNVHRRGVDAATGGVVLRAGTRLSGRHIGIAAAVGAADLVVAQQPRITLLTSGDEVRPFDTPTDALEPQQIRNSNGPLLGAFFEALDAPLLEHRHLSDEPEETLAAAREALSRSHIVVTNGGVSVGQRDHLPWAWRQLGLHTVLHGVAIQPGRPVLVCSDGVERDEGTQGRRDEGTSKLVLGLPGNPVSVLATAHLFVWPAMRLMMNGHDAARATLPWRGVTLREAVKVSSRREVFRAAKVHTDGSASVIQWHGSGDLMHTAEADGLVRLPLQDEEVPAGTAVAYLDFV